MTAYSGLNFARRSRDFLVRPELNASTLGKREIARGVQQTYVPRNDGQRLVCFLCEFRRES